MIRDRINERMDQLQAWMESNYHLEHPDEVETHIHSVSKFWSVLSDEDRDYIHAAQWAIEEQTEWK